MIKLASQILDDINAFAEKNPDTIKNMLLVGGVGAGAGALLTPDSDEDESAGDKALRRVRNAVIGAGLGAGAVGLMSTGAEQFKTAVPVGEVSPAVAAWNSDLTRMIGGTAGLGTGAYFVNKNHNANAQDILDTLTKGNVPDRGASAPINKLQGDIDALADEAANSKHLKTTASKMLHMQNALHTLGDPSRISGKLTDAGIDTGGLMHMNRQGTLARPMFDRWHPEINNKLFKWTRWMSNPITRHLDRNRWTYAAGAAGAFLPEVGNSAFDFLKALFSDATTPTHE